MRTVPGSADCFLLEEFMGTAVSGHFYRFTRRRRRQAKVKVKKWIDMPEPKRYDEFVCTWHYFLKDLERVIGKDTSGQAAKTMSLYLIRQFGSSP